MPFFLTLLIWAAVFIASELLRPKPRFENARPKGLGDFNFPTATEGRVVPIVWGTVKISGPNVVWYGKLKQIAIKEEVKTGLFSSDTITTGYKYYVGMQFAICRGPVDAIIRIYIDEKIASSGRTSTGSLAVFASLGGYDLGSGQVSGTGTFYVGNTTDSRNAYLDSAVTAAKNTAYRGTCYYVFEGGEVGASTSIGPWAFEVRRIPDGLQLASAQPGDEIINGTDANPMNVLYEILTDTDWGLKIPTGEIDVANWRAAAATLASEGNGWSMVLDGEIESSELINEVQRQIDGLLYYDRADSTSPWKIKLARNDYTPAGLDLYDEANIIELVDYARTSWEETTNQVRLLFADNSDNYKQTFALAQDMANVEIQGGNVTADVSYPGVMNGALANAICWRDLGTLSYPLAKATLRVNREGFDLKPGSVFRFSWDRLNISELVMRVGRIGYGMLDRGIIELSCTQDVFAATSGVFGDPSNSNWTGAIDPPTGIATADTLIFEAPRQLVVQDPVDPLNQPRLWCGARDPGGSTVAFQIYSRVGTSRPLAGVYDAGARVTSFLLKATVAVAIDEYGTTNAFPNISYNIDLNLNDPDDIPDINNNRFWSVSGLSNLIYINGEFMAFESGEDIGGSVYRLSTIYRGLFHTAPKKHAVNDDVWLIFYGGNITQRAIASDEDEIDIKLLAQNRSETVSEGSATTEEQTLNANRIWSVPLAPRDPVLNSAYAPASEDVDTLYTSETGFTGDDARALEIDFTRRAWRVDEVGLDTTLANSSPPYLDDSPEFDVVLVLDPSGTPATTALDSLTQITGASADTDLAYVTRNNVIETLGSGTVIPSTARLEVTAKHTPPEIGSQQTNPVKMTFEFTLTSALQGVDDNVYGAFAVSVWSDPIAHSETGAHSIDIKTALPSSGIVEYRINGGSAVTAVSAASSTGSYTVPVASDTVELRFSQAPTADQFFDVTGPSTTAGYGVLLS
jgi:hypothetical protein